MYIPFPLRYFYLYHDRRKLYPQGEPFFFFFFFCGSLVLVRVIVAVVAVVAVLYNRLFVALFVALSHRLVLLLLFMLMVMLYRCSRHLVCRLHVFLPSLSSVLLLLCGSQDSGRRNS